MSLEDDLERLAESVATDWPEIAFSGRLEAAIRELYRSHLRFPPFWTQEECIEFVTDNADMDARQLATQLDDLADVVVDRYGRQHRFLPHDEDAAALIAAERRSAVGELEDMIDCLSEELARAAIHTAGRAVASMTGCSPASRRSQSKIRRKRR
ncbi:MAG: hypothetical protein JWM76_4316 [Pseudonocardiales bacterium]|nr:hypothetical protein [Pseudonocardiales bacterium]